MSYLERRGKRQGLKKKEGGRNYSAIDAWPQEKKDDAVRRVSFEGKESEPAGGPLWNAERRDAPELYTIPLLQKEKGQEGKVVILYLSLTTLVFEVSRGERWWVCCPRRTRGGERRRDRGRGKPNLSLKGGGEQQKFFIDRRLPLDNVCFFFYSGAGGGKRKFVN